jgi:hypothetical protein
MWKSAFFVPIVNYFLMGLFGVHLFNTGEWNS